AEDGIRDLIVTGVQTCALPIYSIATGCETVRSGCQLSFMTRMPTASMRVCRSKAIQATASPRPAGYTGAGLKLAERSTEVPLWRSEERRVGKECRCGGGR